MQQFFLESQLTLNESLRLPDDIARQCRLVLRYRDGQVVRLVGKGQKPCLATLRITEQDVLATPLEFIETQDPDEVRITLIQALIRKERWENFLEKATELGAARIVPLVLERNVVKWDLEEVEGKLNRNRKILKEAAEQSKRSEVPELFAPIRISDLKTYASERNYVAYENEAGLTLKRALQPCRSVSVIIGPEGGIAPHELQAMEQLGFIPVSLGKRILRAETAGPVACAIIETVLEPYENT